MKYEFIAVERLALKAASKTDVLIEGCRPGVME
jgi:hypothetical protein